MKHAVADAVFTLSQTVQFAALGPCIMIVAYLALSTKLHYRIWLACGFFLSLAASFMTPLLPVLSVYDERYLPAVLLALESMLPAFGFLLMLQAIRQRMPDQRYWLVLALPILGGTSFIYAYLHHIDACIWGDDWCLPPGRARSFYQFLASSLTLLWLTVILMRETLSQTHDTGARRHQYWLVISFIATQVAALGVDLMQLAHAIPAKDAMFVQTMLRVAFLYLAFTSVFRVFADQFRQQPMTNAAPPPSLTERETSLADRIRHLMEIDKPYLEMGVSRQSFAKQLGVSENTLSKVVNRSFGQSFTDYVNQYRVEAAKLRLRSESTAVTTIAFEVGFNSLATFNRVFKDKVGIAPSEYRQSCQDSAMPIAS